MEKVEETEAEVTTEETNIREKEEMDPLEQAEVA